VCVCVCVCVNFERKARVIVVYSRCAYVCVFECVCVFVSIWKRGTRKNERLCVFVHLLVCMWVYLSTCVKWYALMYVCVPLMYVCVQHPSWRECQRPWKHTHDQKNHSHMNLYADWLSLLGTRVCVCVSVCVCACMCLCLCQCKCLCLCLRLCLCLCLCLCACMRVYVRVCVCVYVCVGVYTLPGSRLRDAATLSCDGGKRDIWRPNPHTPRYYGVATISRLLKILGLFCKRAL